MVDVEKDALGAFEQDPLAVAAGLVEIPPDGAGEGQNEVRDVGQVGAEALAVDRRLAEAGAKRVVMGAQAVELRAELAEMGEIADPDRAAPDLVLIGGADAATRRSDLAGAAGVLA